jgi:hypothetical protein
MHHSFEVPCHQFSVDFHVAGFLRFIMISQEDTCRLLGRDPTNWLRFMLEIEYPLTSKFDDEHHCVVWLFHQRYPHAPLPFVGLAGIDYWFDGELFDTQDAWHDMKLCKQRSRFREGDGDYIIEGLGLPFERLYFEARRQLFRATNELLQFRAEQYAARRDEIRRNGPPRTHRCDSMVLDDPDGFEHFGRTRSRP